MLAIRAQYAVASRSLFVFSSGASQSAKLGPTPFLRRKSGFRLWMNSIQRCIASQFSSMTALSPYCNHVVHGTITPASPQPGAPTIASLHADVPDDPEPPNVIVLGDTFVNAPCGVCASTMSWMNFCENAAVSKL